MTVPVTPSTIAEPTGSPAEVSALGASAGSPMPSLASSDAATPAVAPPPAARAWEARLDLVLLVAATAVLAIAVGLLVYTILTQTAVYRSSIAVELAGDGPINHHAVLAYARSGDFAAAKSVALCLGFALIFLGAGYTLRAAQTTYNLSVSRDDLAKASLVTSSPGLVMISLGVVLVAMAVLTQSHVDLNGSPAMTTLRVVEDTAD